MGDDTVTAERPEKERPEKADGLEVHAVAGQFVVYEAAADAVHYLNPSAALILEFCDGEHSPDEIADAVQEAYGLDCAPLGEVDGCLIDLRKTGLIR